MALPCITWRSILHVLDRITDKQFADEATPIDSHTLRAAPAMHVTRVGQTTLYMQEKQVNTWRTMFCMYK
jgi:hypothetical protein